MQVSSSHMKAFLLALIICFVDGGKISWKFRMPRSSHDVVVTLRIYLLLASAWSVSAMNLCVYEPMLFAELCSLMRASLEVARCEYAHLYDDA